MGKFVVVANVFLLILVLSVLVLGAWPSSPYEMFEDAKQKQDVKFTAAEEELFADLKNNKLSDKEVQKLIADGVITDQLVDKFFSRISIPKLVRDVTVASKAVASVASTAPTAPAAPAAPTAPTAPTAPAAPAPSVVEKFDDLWASF